ncbi:ABC transporter permease [Mesoplasma melaleucae]|uniref:Uncharacterized protein n=1 Tax=Mesoplasma melaleucae TaxID=81459 RepID=A0A2K8NWV1_9MOLU|nr:ABC transporter permease [Mesoplasma melaleucae]ATZ17678.1 hypothetical protein EMELA_v1c00930 [Mesoplasma melaleucae]
MKLRLILKQSWKDYKNKSILYFVFVMFLTIILGLIIGILAFISYAQLNYDQAHQTKYAGQVYIRNNIASERNKDEILEQRAIVDKDGKLKQYIIDNLNPKTVKKINNYFSSADIEIIVNDYIDILGKFFNGNIKTLKNTSKEVISTLSDQYNTNSNLIVDINKDLYWNLPAVSSELMLIYFYDTLKADHQLWFNPIFSDFKDKFNNYLVAYLAPTYRDNVKSDEEYNKHREFHESSASNFHIYEEKKTAEFSEEDQQMIYAGQYLYATPKYLTINNLKVGEKIEVFYNDKSYSMLIKGTMITPYTTAMNYNQGLFTISAKGFAYLSENKKTYDENDLRLNNQRLLFTEEGNNWAKTGHIINEEINKHFKYSKAYGNNNQLLPDRLEVIWSPSFLEDVYWNTYKLLAKILGLVIIGLLILIFIVFYFMCENFLRQQKESFYNLKAMGVNNFVLTLLSSFSAIIPIFISLILSLFVAVPISRMLATSVSTAYSFDWPPILFTWKLLIYIFLIILCIFTIFMFNNFIVLNGKKSKIDKFKESKKPSKFIMMNKKMLTPLPSRTRIGLSFALTNVAKNIYCLIILSLVFTVILFTFQFNVSVNNSANSMISFANPDISIKYQSSSWDLKTIYDEEGNVQEYQHAYDQINKYDDLNKLFVVDNLDKFIDMAIYTSLNANIIETSKNNISNYMISGDYIYKLATSITSEAELKEIINKNVIPRIDNLVIKDVAKKWLTNSDNQTLMWNYYKLFQDKIKSMKASLHQLDIDEKSIFPINVLFGKTVIIPGEKNYWSSGVSFSSISTNNDLANATSVSASRKQHQNSFGSNKLNNFYSESTITKIKLVNGNEVSGLKIQVAQPLANRYRLRVGDTMFMSVNSLKTNEIADVKIPIVISGFMSNDLVTQNVYFEKTDYFRVLKETLKNKILHFNTTNVKEETKNPLSLGPAWTSYIKFLDDTIEKSDTLGSNDNLVLNNSQFSKEDIPVNLRYLTLPKVSNDLVLNKISESQSIKSVENERTDILSYWDNIDGPNDFWKSKNGKYINSLSNDLYNYRLIKEAILLKAAPFQNIMRTLDQALVGIVLSISLVIITLILFENKNTIILFKSLGYKTREINKYLITGYVLSGIVALIFALVANNFMISYLSQTIYDAVGISLVYVLSSSYILYGVILTASFILLILGSIKIYTRRQNPKEVIK